MKPVDLSEKINEQKLAAQKAAELASQKIAAAAVLKKPAQQPRKAIPKSRAADIDQIYDDREVLVDEELHKIDQPAKKNPSRQSGKPYKAMTFVLLSLLIVGFVYVYFFQDKSAEEKIPVTQGTSGWYSIKLINGEVYYGQIDDLSADPVIVKNVYYNYDQISAEPGAEEKSESGNLRLVKRGKEIHGPDGSLSVVRAQVVYMEPMKEDSKVLKVILDNEKK